ncbi:MAG TPA: GAF and ANTAR domain-containing protein [Acidimicrobiales bacterium]|nr:GAF and ANTAR domain-containing protein [Acidimicrobiales bacterium]
MTDAEQTTAELAASIAEAAQNLYSADSVPATLQRIVELAVETVDGCDLAGIFLREDKRVTTPAVTEPLVVELDNLQISADEGPCLDAVAHGKPSYAEDLADDDRWPRFGPAAAAAGIRSLLAFPLPADGPPAALNLYSRLPSAYGAIDRAKGLIFATLAGHALQSAQTRAEEVQRSEDLHQALLTRGMIGQAQGILMERERITAEQAFDVLRRASQHLNVKLREIAQALVETGEDPDTGDPSPPATP